MKTWTCCVYVWICVCIFILLIGLLSDWLMIAAAWRPYESFLLHLFLFFWWIPTASILRTLGCYIILFSYVITLKKSFIPLYNINPCCYSPECAFKWLSLLNFIAGYLIFNFSFLLSFYRFRRWTWRLIRKQAIGPWKDSWKGNFTFIWQPHSTHHFKEQNLLQTFTLWFRLIPSSKSGIVNKCPVSERIVFAWSVGFHCCHFSVSFRADPFSVEGLFVCPADGEQPWLKHRNTHVSL